MKPHHLGIRVNPDDGRIWATKEQRNAPKPIQRIRDITDDVLMALCADISADSMTTQIERSIRFTDGMECKVTVELIAGPREWPTSRDGSVPEPGGDGPQGPGLPDHSLPA